MTILFTNNAASTLASGITNVATSLTVATGQGALFPSPTGAQFFYATLENTGATIREIVKVTARTTDTFTIVRGQDGTTAAAWSTGDKVQLRVTAADLNNFGQLDTANTWASGQVFVAPVLGTPASGNFSTGTFTWPTFNQNTTGTAANITGLLAIANGGTNSTATATAGGVGYGTGTAHAYTAAGTAGQLLTSGGAGAPAWVTILPIANGGTNSTATPTLGGVGYGTGTAHAYTAAGTAGQVLTSNGAAAPTWQAAAGGGGGLGGQTVFTASGTFTIPTGKTVVKVTVIGGGGSGYNVNTGNGGNAGGSTSVSSGTQTITTFTATGGSAGGTNPNVNLASSGTCAASDIPFGYLYNFGGSVSSYTCGSSVWIWSPTQVMPALSSVKGVGGAVSFIGNNGSNGSANWGTGGGAGGCGSKYFTGLTPGNTITVTVGAGGTQTTGGNAGTAGMVIFEY